MFLDTVKIAIPVDNRFDFGMHPIQDIATWNKRTNNNATIYSFKEDRRKLLANGTFDYVPRVEYIEFFNRYKVSKEFQVEFSIPKLINIYNVNYLPVLSEQLDTVICKLWQVLHYNYGFRSITIEMIETAILRRMDCMATVLFPNHTLAKVAANRLKDIHIEKRVDVGSTSYRTNGELSRVTCSNWDLVVYDKLAETESITRKRIDNFSFYASKEQQDLERKEPILEKIKEQGVGLLQCEVRFNTKAKINKALPLINEQVRDLTLREALERKIPLRLLRFYWLKCIDGAPRYDLWRASEEDTMNALLATDMSISQLSKSFTIARMQAMPQHDLQKIARRQHSAMWLYRLKQNAEKIPSLSNDKDLLSYITDCLATEDAMFKEGRFSQDSVKNFYSITLPKYNENIIFDSLFNDWHSMVFIRHLPKRYNFTKVVRPPP